jgi:hypothetical protein
VVTRHGIIIQSPTTLLGSNRQVVSFFGILFVSQRVYRFTWQVQLSSPYTPKVLQTYLMGPGHYSTVTIMVIR